MKRLTFIVTLVAFFVMGWIIVRADQSSLPPVIKWLYDFPGGDKVGHFILFGVLAALLDATMRRRNVTIGPIRLSLAAVLVASAEVIEEGTQAFYPARSIDFTDVMASSAGIAVFVWLFRRGRSQQAKV